MSINKKQRMAYSKEAERIISQMSLEEKAELLSGNSDLSKIREAFNQTQNYSYYPYTGAGYDKDGKPRLRFSDGSRGAVMGLGKSTCFPAMVCRGATFDVNLERQIGKAIARELLAYGANVFGGVSVNVPYHPGWGRSQEVYGEDTFAIGKMAAAFVKGIQSEGVIACVKHYAFNSMENKRLIINIESSKRAEREVFLAQFKDCIDAGAACIMGAYNGYNGESCCQNKYLMRDVLRDEWGFDGIVLSDWFWGIRQTDAIIAGTDLEMPVQRYYGDELVREVREGRIPEKFVDEAALHVLRTLISFSDYRDKKNKNYKKDIIGCRKHALLGIRAAREGITLLKNTGELLPLKKKNVKNIALIGRLAEEDNLGDHGSSRVFPRHSVSPVEAILKAVPGAGFVYYRGDDIAHVRRVAGEVDTVVVVAGCNYQDEGEYSNMTSGIERKKPIGGDRISLRLSEHDEELIKAVGETNKNCVVVLIGGGPIVMTNWIDSISSVILAYYPGQDGGTAIADVLFGRVNPSGKLPFAIPVDENDIHAIIDVDNEVYDYYHGYTKLDKEGKSPMLSFGFGLSYTSFIVSDVNCRAEGNSILAECTVENTGKMRGDEVVQMYIGFPESAVDRPVRTLRDFLRVSLAPGEKKAVKLSCPFEKLKYYDEEAGKFTLEHMKYDVYIGTSSDLADLKKESVSL